MLTAPVFGLGGLHRVVSQRQRTRILETAYEVGFRTFDVAPSYGEGLVESAVGRFVKQTGHDVAILTKFGIPYRAIGELPAPIFYGIRTISAVTRRSFGADYSTRDFSVSSLRKSVTSSLRRLCVDVIDCLFIHEPLGDKPSDDFEPLWNELERIRHEGLIRSFGLTLGTRHPNLEQWVGSIPASAAVMVPVTDALLAKCDVVTSRNTTLAFDFVTYLRNQTRSTPSVADVVRFSRTRLPRVRPVIATRHVARISQYGRAFVC